MPLVQLTLTIIGIAGLSLAAGYAALSVIAVLIWQLRRTGGMAAAPAGITVLKPLCGSEPGLYEYLRSFCLQNYPQYQLVFGVRDQADPARLVAERLAAEFPALSIAIVVDPQLHGSNCKISNLINMLPHARHDVLVMSDSDALVGAEYLSSVTAPLADPNVGLVTCLYRGMPTPLLWSRLGAMYVNEWYTPSVLLAWLFGHQGYVSGQTICVTRGTLLRIGGLAALANHLADDNRMGELVRKLGLRVVLSPYLVTAAHHEPSLQSVTRHELRWMRTLRVLRPRSFRWLFLTFSLPLAILGLALTFPVQSDSVLVKALFGTVVGARLVLHFAPRLHANRNILSDLWLVPIRDFLLCWVWLQSFFASQVTWRGNSFVVDPNGVMRRLS
jgi:ceramide glucosyltransferase